jgi:uncharacterized membrane protein YdjX (TVP38/TMEM64 family)
MERTRMNPTRRQIAAGLTVAGLLTVGFLLSPRAAFEVLRTYLYSPWWPLLLVGLYLIRPLLAWPITALSVVVGYRYGLGIGVPIALLGAVGTSLLPYAFGRYYRDRAGPFAGWIAGSKRFFAATGDIRGIIAVRLAPTPAEPVSIAAGTGRVRVPAFMVGTAIGELPWTVAAVLAGHSLNRLSIATVAAVDPWVFVAGLMAAGLLLAGPAYRWLERRAPERFMT